MFSVLNGTPCVCTSVTEGIEALAVTRVIVRPAGELAEQGVVKTALLAARYAAK